jgi:hypothetical protein
MTYQPPSLADLRANFKTAREVLDQRYFPEDLINGFADYIDWVVEKTPAETVNKDPELRKFFFEEFIGGIAVRVSNIKELPDNVSEYSVYWSILNIP